jgi:hypothetical protein
MNVVAEVTSALSRVRVIKPAVLVHPIVAP